MHWRFFLSMAALALAIFSHAGCDSPPDCAPGFEGPYDNRDGQLSEAGPHDWICVDRYERVAPPPPALGGDKPLDAAGPKDMDAVAKAAIFVESCVGAGIGWQLNINARIEAIYSTLAERALDQAISDRVNCFKDKANGCEAARECLGLQAVIRETADQEGCVENGNAMVITGGSEEPPFYGKWYNLWYNCKGLGLACIDNFRSYCELPREECTELISPYCTENNEPRYCGLALDGGKINYNIPHPSCTKVGLTCRADSETAYCAGSGPSCTWKPRDQASADFGQGIACEDTNTLRACVNGYEEIVDCSQMAMGFHCIDGSRPHCGADFQCNYDRSNPLPTCNGTVLEVCNGGVRTQIDCKSLGFETCEPVRGLCGPIVANAAP